MSAYRARFPLHRQDGYRSYTPTRPILSNEENGTFELVVKTYFPTDDEPGGAMSNILDCMPIGEEIDIRGQPAISHTKAWESSKSKVEMAFRNVTLILGGSGITPGYQLIARILKSEGDETKLRVIDANKSG
jgi:nitrate reductase (NAD(P)H)